MGTASVRTQSHIQYVSLCPSTPQPLIRHTAPTPNPNQRLLSPHSSPPIRYCWLTTPHPPSETVAPHTACHHHTSLPLTLNISIRCCWTPHPPYLTLQLSIHSYIQCYAHLIIINNTFFKQISPEQLSEQKWDSDLANPMVEIVNSQENHFHWKHSSHP